MAYKKRHSFCHYSGGPLGVRISRKPPPLLLPSPQHHGLVQPLSDGHHSRGPRDPPPPHVVLRGPRLWPPPRPPRSRTDHVHTSPLGPPRARAGPLQGQKRVRNCIYNGGTLRDKKFNQFHKILMTIHDRAKKFPATKFSPSNFFSVRHSDFLKPSTQLPLRLCIATHHRVHTERTLRRMQCNVC